MADAALAAAAAQRAGSAAPDSTDVGNAALRSKNARVKAEQDLRLLQNRINRLVIEEERAAKRIAETRRRAKEILELKRRNKTNSAAQQEAAEWMHSEQELQRQLLWNCRTERANAVNGSRTAMKQLRRNEVGVLRQMRKENEEALAAQRDMELQRVVARKQLVQEQQRCAQQRKQQERQAAMQKLKEDRELKQFHIDDDANAQMLKYEALVEEERRIKEVLAKHGEEQANASQQISAAVASRASSEYAG